MDLPRLLLPPSGPQRRPEGRLLSVLPLFPDALNEPNLSPPSRLHFLRCRWPLMPSRCGALLPQFPYGASTTPVIQVSSKQKPVPWF